MRQTAGAGERGQVFFRALRVALVTQRQGAIQEEVARLRRDLHQLRYGELLQGLTRFADPGQVLAHDPGIHLAHLGTDFTGLVIFDLDLVERFIRTAFAERGEMGNGRHERVMGTGGLRAASRRGNGKTGLKAKVFQRSGKERHPPQRSQFSSVSAGPFF